jgi:hypothetical protein
MANDLVTGNPFSLENIDRISSIPWTECVAPAQRWFQYYKDCPLAFELLSSYLSAIMKHGAKIAIYK